MPYVKQEQRNLMNPDLMEVANTITCKGDLNYAISTLMHLYVKNTKMNYQCLSDARAAALDAADEFYRSVIAPYEDIKAKENGSVSDLDEKFFGVTNKGNKPE